MRLRHFSRAGYLTLLASLVLATATAVAKDGRDFAGFYSVTNVNRQGPDIQVVLTLQLFNYSGADIKQAAVTISEAHPGMRMLGTYAPIPIWRNGSSAVMNLHIAVPREEYQRWGARRQPSVAIIYSDDQGKQWQRTAQISRRPAIPLGEDSSDAQ